MKKILKWTGIVLVSLILLLLLASWILVQKFEGQFKKEYDQKVEMIPILRDSASLERGRILSVQCRECHGADLAGKVFFDEPEIGVLPSSNLTRGKGSQTEGYTDIDYIRALRHGLNPKGNPLLVMPSDSYAHLSDHDLGCLIGFIQSLPSIERNFPPRRFTYLTKVMAVLGAFGEITPYKVIEHDKVHHVTGPVISNQPEYGLYLMKIHGCKGCHGENLAGGKSGAPEAPIAPNISKGGNIGKWSLAQFIETMRTGTTPEGKALNAEYMAFASIAAHGDMEMEALYNYIYTLPAAATPEVK